MKVGAFDVGTNTVLMLAAEIDGAARPRAILECSRITRLGRGVDRTGRLDPESAARTLEAIAEFAARGRALGVERFVAAGTASLRDAANGAEFIAQVRERAGVELEIISGLEEARLAHLAVTRGLALDPELALLIVDVGGGSTELIRAQPHRALEMVSLQIGSVRMTERYLHGDPPSPCEVREMTDAIAAALEAARWDFRPAKMVGIAGTVTTICAVSLAMATYDSAIVHGRTLPRAEVERVTELFGSRTLAERRELPGLIEGRADVIYAGAMILLRVMDSFGAREVIVSDQGVRWGLIWREADRITALR
jgi:exopolyphosphatase/guanosine-5'-triphosphate,3'-diphosphate pyrophosphatase